MFGHGSNKISAEQNNGADTTVDDLLAGFDGVDALCLRRLDAEKLLERVSWYLLGFFRNPGGALTLHIGVASNRADTRAWTTYVAAHQSQVDQGLNGFDA